MDPNASQDPSRKISTLMSSLSACWRRIAIDADTKWLVWAESRFASIAGKDTSIDRESFKNALEVQNVFFADRFFDLFDNDHSGTVSQQEMMDGLFLLTMGAREDKLRFFFDVYDMDGSPEGQNEAITKSDFQHIRRPYGHFRDQWYGHTYVQPNADNGYLDKDELRVLLKTGIDESSVQLSDRKLNHLTDTLFGAADQNNDGAISFEEFMVALSRYPDLLENFTICAAAWLHDTKPNEKRCCRRISCLRTSYLRNNITRIGFMLCFFLVNCALFAEAAYRYSFNPDANWCFLIARGCGQALNFNCAVVVLMLLRKCLSFLRATWLMHILPVNDTIRIHKTIGYIAAVLSLTHTLGHIGNALILQTYKDFTAVELLFTNTSIIPVGIRVGKLAGSAFITGWILDAVFLILIVGSLSFVRRSGHFQIFYWTHKISYFVFWFLLILHGPSFWCWFLGPAILFVLEKISEMKIVHNIRFGKTYVKEANLLSSGVTHLVMTKPPNFKYKAGDYIFIQIPQIAKYEWHPFTISSAPEQIGIVSLHIRSAGNWTKSLYRFFDDMQPVARKKSLKMSPTPREPIYGSVSTDGKPQPHGGEMINRGFEMTTLGENKNANDKPPPGEDRNGSKSLQVSVVDEAAVSIISVDNEVQAPPVMKVRRVNFKSDLNPQTVLQWRKATGVADEIQEKDDNDIAKTSAPEIEDDQKQSKKTHDLEKSTQEAGKENEDNFPISAGSTSPTHESRKRRATDCIASASMNEASHPMTSSGICDRKVSKQVPRPNIIFDISTKNKIQVCIQGPYGTPSTSIFQSEHAVLIGTGIGVTPYASIVQSIVYRHRSIINRCPNCEHSWVDVEREKQALGVKKVDFVWLNRNHTSFEWFVDMLLNLEYEQSQYSLDRFLDIHLFMTGIQRFDIKNFGLQMALDLVHEKENRDLLTGLRTKLQAGRPNWKQLFQEIKKEDKGKVSVFFCGAPALASVVSKHCEEFGFRFHKESF